MTSASQDTEKMRELEDFTHFRARLDEYSPDNFTIDELKEILDDMIRSKVAIEDHMREHIATLTETE